MTLLVIWLQPLKQYFKIIFFLPNLQLLLNTYSRKMFKPNPRKMKISIAVLLCFFISAICDSGKYKKTNNLFHNFNHIIDNNRKSYCILLFLNICCHYIYCCWKLIYNKSWTHFLFDSVSYSICATIESFKQFLMKL